MELVYTFFQPDWDPALTGDVTFSSQSRQTTLPQRSFMGNGLAAMLGLLAGAAVLVIIHFSFYSDKQRIIDWLMRREYCRTCGKPIGTTLGCAECFEHWVDRQA
jgi:hypothetical protein